MARAGCTTRQRKEWDMNSVVEHLHFWVGDHMQQYYCTSGMNDTKCDPERKTRLVGRSRGIHVNKYKT